MFVTKAGIEWSSRDFETGLTAWALRSARTGRNKLAAAWHWQCSPGMSRRVFFFCVCVCACVFAFVRDIFPKHLILQETETWVGAILNLAYCQDRISMLDLHLATSIKSWIRLAIEPSKILTKRSECLNAGRGCWNEFVNAKTRDMPSHLDLLLHLDDVCVRCELALWAKWHHRGQLVAETTTRSSNEFRLEGLKLVQFGPLSGRRFHVSGSQELCYYCDEWRRLVVIWFVIRQGEAHKS